MIGNRDLLIGGRCSSGGAGWMRGHEKAKFSPLTFV